ncbi:hypothetical protein SMICM17S_00813 [Streptomyces microflavus]
MRVAGCAGALAQGGGQRPCLASRHRQVHPLHADEVEAHGELVAPAGLRFAEEPGRVGVGQVDLAQQDGLTVAAPEEGPQVGQVLVRVGQLVRVLLAVGLQQEGNRVDAEAGQPQLRPETHDAGYLVAYRGVGDIEVGLLLEEAVQVVLAGGLVQLPHTALGVGEDHALRAVVGRCVAPDVPVAVGGCAAGTGVLEPRMVVGGVVDHQVGDDPDTPVAGGPHELGEVAERAQPRIDGVEVGDVVAVVALPGRIERPRPAGRREAPVRARRGIRRRSWGAGTRRRRVHRPGVTPSAGAPSPPRVRAPAGRGPRRRTGRCPARVRRPPSRRACPRRPSRR